MDKVIPSWRTIKKRYPVFCMDHNQEVGYYLCNTWTRKNSQAKPGFDPYVSYFKFIGLHLMSQL
jgi:hypothetical protein